MKLQYLGDSEDAFKWDYLDFLARRINVSYLDIIPMKTPADGSGQGKTSPSRFPASNSVQQFCCHLRQNRSFDELPKLPRYTNGNYEIRLQKPNDEFKHASQYQAKYFAGIPSEKESTRILFLDADIGFQPEKTVNSKHVKYTNVATIWPRVTDDTLVCVFQHGRQKYCPFEQHHAEIKRGLQCIRPFFSTAVYWGRDLMFVLLGTSSSRIGEAREVNGEYQSRPRPVQVIDG